jgi:hypothetical protein
VEQRRIGELEVRGLGVAERDLRALDRAIEVVAEVVRSFA